MKVETLENGQIVAQNGNLELTQTIISGVTFNDCSIHHGDFVELVSQHDDRFRELFIAIHHYKTQGRQKFLDSI